MIDTQMYRNASKQSGYETTIHALCDEIDRLRAAKPKPQGKTVRVNVAVAVDKNGTWLAEGWDNAQKDMLEDMVKKRMSGKFYIHWLTADLPITEEMAVEAEVGNA